MENNKRFFVSYTLSTPKVNFIGGARYADVWEVIGYVWDILVTKKYSEIRIQSK